MNPTIDWGGGRSVNRKAIRVKGALRPVLRPGVMPTSLAEQAISTARTKCSMCSCTPHARGLATDGPLDCPIGVLVHRFIGVAGAKIGTYRARLVLYLVDDSSN